MATLRSPSGALYHTEDPRKIKDLCLGQGYKVVDEDQAPAVPQPPAAQQQLPAAQQQLPQQIGEPE
jgi:hypothetical protein